MSGAIGGGAGVRISCGWKTCSSITWHFGRFIVTPSELNEVSNAKNFWTTSWCFIHLHRGLVTQYGIIHKCRSGSTLAQIRTWCLVTQIHYLNQCWHLIKVFCDIRLRMLMQFIHSMCSEITHWWLPPYLPWLMSWLTKSLSPASSRISNQWGPVYQKQVLWTRTIYYIPQILIPAFGAQVLKYVTSIM